MASRWRIRHKLLLGLGLVVLLMAVLLSGTLRGLWAYYATTNGIRSKLQELFAAEQFKLAVGELTSSENTDRMLLQPATVPAEIRKVRDSLDEYSNQLEETVAHGFDSRRGLYERELVAGLQGDLDEYEKAVERCIRPVLVPNNGGKKGDKKDDNPNLDALAGPRATLSRDTLDLRDHIKKELGDRLNTTRGHYQGVLKIVVPASVSRLAHLDRA